MSVVFALKDILGLIIFVSGGNNERKNSALYVVDFSIFSSFEIYSYQSAVIGLLTTSTLWSSVGGFVGRFISLFPISCMCLI